MTRLILKYRQLIEQQVEKAIQSKQNFIRRQGMVPVFWDVHGILFTNYLEKGY